MAYPVEHYYLTFGGTLCQDEIWQCGMHFAPSSGENIFDRAFQEISLADIFQDLAEWVQDWDAHSGPGSGFSTKCTLGWARLAVKDRAGLDKFNSRVYYPETPVTGVSSTGHAPQVCYVVTLWSGQKVRRANWGRFYVPMPVASWTYDNGRMDQAYCDNLATRAGELIKNINGEVSTVGVQTYPCIISKVGTGEVKSIQKIAVGRVLDTQQRRRNKLDEGLVYQDL